MSSLRMIYLQEISRNKRKQNFQIGNRGTVKEAAGFDPESDVKKLREAMKGMGEWTDQSNCRKKKKY